MTTYVIRSARDAIAALRAFDTGDDPPSLWLDGFPRVLITVPEGIGARSARAINRLQTLIHREFCLWKYGAANLRKLTAADKQQTELHVEFPRPTQMLVDLSRAATALGEAVRTRCLSPGVARMADLFGDAKGASKWDTARDVGLAIVDKITPDNLAKLAMRGIVIAALTWTSTAALSLLLNYSVAWQKEENAHQLRLAALEQTKIIGGAGVGAVVAPAAHRAVERDLEFDSQRVRKLLVEQYQGPFSRFVRLAGAARSPLLELARDSTIDIDGVTIGAGAARFAAKALKSDPDYGWKAVVHATKAIDS